VDKTVYAHLVPEQCDDYAKAIRIVAEKQHFTTMQYWDKHDLVMSHEQSGKAIDQMGKLTEELEKIAVAIYQYPAYTNEQLGKDVLYLSSDQVYTKTKKLWLKLGLTCKKDLAAFLVGYYSKHG
jgi:hypothetical protein